MGFLAVEPSLVSWTLLTVAALSAAVIGKVGLGMLRAYYILRVRAGLPVVLWFPKFWRMDGRRQTGSSLSRVLKRMERLRGPHGMYGTVFGSQAVMHVADPEAAALVLSQHTKRPGYDHFGSFFGRGVFTADGDEWRKKRVSVAHALFRGSSNLAPSRGGSGVTDGRGGGEHNGGSDGGGSGGGGGGKTLAVLANEEADSLLREVQALRDEKGGGEGEVQVEIVRLLQRHTLNLIHRFLCGGEDVCASPERKRLLPRYLDAVTDMRMVILARSRSVWMFAWGWVYRALSPFHAREARNMIPIREFAELVLDTAVRGGANPSAAMHDCGSDINSSGNTARSINAPTGSRETAGIGSSESSIGEVGGGRRIGIDGESGAGGIRRRAGKAEETEGHDEDEEEGVVVGDEAVTPQRAGRRCGDKGASGESGGGKPGVLRRSAERSAAQTDVSGKVGPKTALSNMAARESHTAYPGSMVDETITLLFAGQDTSAATLSWTMHLLSLPENRPYLLQVRQEVLAAVDQSGNVDCSGSSNSSNGNMLHKKRSLPMPMVDACIRESQRLYPVAPFVVRHLSSDLRLKDGTLLPAGALACVWIYGLHRHPAFWESPDAFLPGRWLNDAATRQPAGAFIPYASGPRGCVGRPFAGVALRILLARLCLALDFSPADPVVADTTAAASSSDTITRRDSNSLPVKISPSVEGGSKGGDVIRLDGVMVPLTKGKADHDEDEVRGEGNGRFAENKDFCGEREVLLDGGHGMSGADGKAAGVQGSGGGNKDMQAGFTVLPGGGVHLRLQKWQH